MSLDTSLHIIYGYRLENTPIEDTMDRLNADDKISDEEYDELYETLTETTDEGLTLITDDMCGKYEFIGIEIMRKCCDYGEDFYSELDLNDIKSYCDDTLLDSTIQKYLPFLIGDLYDVAGLMNGQLPKLYFVKRVW